MAQSSSFLNLFIYSFIFFYAWLIVEGNFGLPSLEKSTQQPEEQHRPPRPTCACDVSVFSCCDAKE